MITINLLPEEYKKQHGGADQDVEIEAFHLAMRIAGITLSLLVVFYIVFVYFPLKRNEHLKDRSHREFKKIEAEYHKAETVKEEENSLKQQLRSMQDMRSSIQWAQKLNDLSDALPGEIQLMLIDVKAGEEKVSVNVKEKKSDGEKSKIVDKKVERKKRYYTLDIEGKVVFFGGENKVGKFIEQLNKTPTFIQDFEYIKLLSISVLNEELKLFSIRCRFKDELQDHLDS